MMVALKLWLSAGKFRGLQDSLTKGIGMNKRPIPVLVISWIFIAAGALGLVYHLYDLKAPHQFHFDIVWISLVSLLAIVAGAFMLRGNNWARWLALAWMGFHVGVSAFHARQELIVHGVLFVIIVFFLFLSGANRFFGADEPSPTAP